jgi:hypothetical protein
LPWCFVPFKGEAIVPMLFLYSGLPTEDDATPILELVGNNETKQRGELMIKVGGSVSTQPLWLIDCACFTAHAADRPDKLRGTEQALFPLVFVLSWSTWLAGRHCARISAGNFHAQRARPDLLGEQRQQRLFELFLDQYPEPRSSGCDSPLQAKHVPEEFNWDCYASFSFPQYVAHRLIALNKDPTLDGVRSHLLAKHESG